MPKIKNWSKLGTRELPSTNYTDGWRNDKTGTRILIRDTGKAAPSIDFDGYDIEIWEKSMGSPEPLESTDTLDAARKNARNWMERHPNA